jgi:hypothetical protein
VVVAALGAARFLAPAHVKDFYMSRVKRSLVRRGDGENPRHPVSRRFGIPINALRPVESEATAMLGFLRFRCGEPAAES